MIKFSGKFDGVVAVGLGLTEENVRELKDGHALSIDCEEFGLPRLTVIVFYGRTLEDLETDLLPLMGPNATIIDRTGRKPQ